MKSYNKFILSTNETYQIFESIQIEDRNNFLNIFNSIYEYHLTDFEKTLIDNYNFRLNESWFSDLKDKAEKGVLKIKSKSGELLTSLAQKAKDILDFVKQLATQIKDAVSNMFNDSLKTIKSKIIPKPELLTLITEYMNKKGDILKKWLEGAGTLIKFVFTELPVKLFNKLINFFKGVFNKGTNEGFDYFCNEFLNEENDNGAEKKSFLQKLGDKIGSLPPFSWIPKIEEMIKYGLYSIRGFIEKFFVWLDKDDIVTETIDLFRERSKFTRGLAFLFDILEIYIIYVYNEKIGKKLKELQDAIKNGEQSIIQKFKDEIKNVALDEIYTKIGISPQDVINKVLDVVKKIPYISDILAILNNLALCVGIYQTIQPTLAKIKSDSTTGIPAAPEGAAPAAGATTTSTTPAGAPTTTVATTAGTQQK